MNETSLQNIIRLEASKRGIHLWRNNSGVATTVNGRPVRFGLGNDSAKLNKNFKSSDLIGIMPGGRFIAIECKKPDWIGPRTQGERAQQAFMDCVKAVGGIAGFVTSKEDFICLIS